MKMKLLCAAVLYLSTITRAIKEGLSEREDSESYNDVIPQRRTESCDEKCAEACVVRGYEFGNCTSPEDGVNHCNCYDTEVCSYEVGGFIRIDSSCELRKHTKGTRAELPCVEECEQEGHLDGECRPTMKGTTSGFCFCKKLEQVCEEDAIQLKYRCLECEI